MALVMSSCGIMCLLSNVFSSCLLSRGYWLVQNINNKFVTLLTANQNLTYEMHKLMILCDTLSIFPSSKSKTLTPLFNYFN